MLIQKDFNSTNSEKTKEDMLKDLKALGDLGNGIGILSGRSAKTFTYPEYLSIREKLVEMEKLLKKWI